MLTGCIAPADADLLAELLGLGTLRMLTLAPELEGAAGLAKATLGCGVVISAGHSNATFEIAYEAIGDRGRDPPV